MPNEARIVKPLFIVSAPRAGSTLLFETLAKSPDAWTIRHESHGVFERIAKLHPRYGGFQSNRLLAGDALPHVAATIRSAFLQKLKNRDRQSLTIDTQLVRMIEKTPKNALRIPFLDAVFPDALFVYLYRDPHQNISSLIEAWRCGRYVSYRRLPGWSGLAWSLLLIPNWRDLVGRPLAEIAAAQWSSANQTILDDLAELPSDRWTALSYGDFIRNPLSKTQRLCQFADIGWDRLLPTELPPSKSTLTAPDPEKWKKNSQEIQDVLPRVAQLAKRAEALVARCASVRH